MTLHPNSKPRSTEPPLSACSYSLPCGRDDRNATKMRPFHNVVEPLFESEEYLKFTKHVSILKRISLGFFSWAGNSVPNDAHFWGKQDFLSDPQFQGDSEINYFRKTNTDLVTFLQTEGWLCLLRIRKILRMLNVISHYEDTIESLSKTAGFPFDSWGTVFEKMHPSHCKCAPCAALKDVKKQLQKKSITAQEVNHAAIHHLCRCVYRVLISGIDRIFETFCSRDFSIVWFILSEEFEEYYRDAEFEKLSSLIMNDVVAIEPVISLGDFGKLFSELYDGATDLARAVLHKFAVILGSHKMFYTTSMNFIMFYIESFNMTIRMLRWMETKFGVFNQLANQISDQSFEDRLDFKSLILHILNKLVFSIWDVVNRRKISLHVIAAYQRVHKSYFGPHIDNIVRYLEYIDTTLRAASTVFRLAKLPSKCPPFKVPKKNVIESALYINPYRDDQFDAPQVFHCYYQNRFIIERSQTPWKILYNSKAKILLRFTGENPAEKGKKLSISVFSAEETTTAEDRIKDQYFALYENRLDRVVEFFDVLKQEVIDYYSNPSSSSELGVVIPKRKKKGLRKNARSVAGAASGCRRRRRANRNKISVPVKLTRPAKSTRYCKKKRMAILASIIHKHSTKHQKRSTIENLEQLLTFAVKTGLKGSGMLPELAGDKTKDVYVSITTLDKVRRAKAEQELSLHELMSFIIFSYARHGCVTEFEGHTLHRTTFGCTKASFKDNFPLLYKAAEELDAAVGEGLLSDKDIAALEKGLNGAMTDAEIERCKMGLETTLLMKREFNELVSSKKAFTKLTSSQFCVTLTGTVDALTGEAEIKKSTRVCERKPTIITKEVRLRMRKTLEERHSEYLASAMKNSPVLKVQQGKFVIEEVPPQLQKPKEIVKETKESTEASADIDVDELVQLIEGTQIKMDPNPKKAAKKARQKEKKELERQRLAEEKARDERALLVEEEMRQAEERRREEEERRKREEEAKRQQEEFMRKQREAAEQRKEEQRKKRLELERRKVEEKKLKKEAKKQRREQRKKDLEQVGQNNASQANRQHSTESLVKTETKNSRGSCVQLKNTNEIKITAEKEYGRLKHEKEQRKREEEEARRLEQLKAQERVQATKKNKKKKKKSKQTSEIGDGKSQTEPSTTNVTPVGQPLLELLNASNNNSDGQGKNSDEKSNLVTIRKHMDSSVTISMRGKEGEKDLVYTLMNGQVYPTGNDGKLRSEEALPLQQTAFVKPEYPKPNSQSLDSMSYVPPPKPVAYSSPPPPPSYVNESTSSAEIDLTQLKLPPGITITRVPQSANAARSDLNGVQPSEFYSKTTPTYVNDYQRPAPITGGDTRFNSNIMVVDSRCSSIESPVTGIRSSDMVYGTNGTRPSSETSIASDRPSSGMDSICNNGAAPFVPRTGYRSTEMLNKHVPISMMSPFTAVSRNETPSPTWHPHLNNNVSPNFAGFPGMISQPNHHSMIPERHGLWSSTPASPVSFPQPGVPDGYLRAQDHQFIKPRPNPRIPFISAGKPTPPGVVYNENRTNRSSYNNENRTSYIGRPAVVKPIGHMVSNRPGVTLQGHSVGNGLSSPSVRGSVVDRPAVISTRSALLDEWTPWNQNADRFSPDMPSPGPPEFFGPTSYSLHSMLQDDSNVPWESSACEKLPTGATNPYGPIGSNITRRSSTAASNGSFDKMSDGSSSREQGLWAYNPTF